MNKNIVAQNTQLRKVIVFQENIGEWFYRIPGELFKFDLFWNEKMLHVMASQIFLGRTTGLIEGSPENWGYHEKLLSYQMGFVIQNTIRVNKTVSGTPVSSSQLS